MNELITNAPGRTVFVLIDTWWNVNQYEKETAYKMIDRFNRYMVECEYGMYNDV